MRLLFVTSEYPPYAWGGLGRYSLEVVRRLAQLHEVDVLCLPTYAVAHATCATDVHGAMAGRVCFRFPRAGLDVDATYADPAQRIDSTLLEWLRGPYDVILAQDFFVAPIVAELFHARLARSVVSFCHLPLYAGFSYFDRPDAANTQHALEAQLFRLSARILVPSRFTRQVILQSHAPHTANVIVVPEGVGDVSIREVTARRCVPRLLSVARLTAQKGTPYMVDLADRLHELGLSFTYTIVGDGPMDGYLATRIAGAKSKAMIRRRRTVGHDSEIFDLYRTHDFLVSVSVYETFGLALLEAMSCGCTPVAFSVGAVDEVVVDGTGVLVDVGDVQGMASAIVGAWADRPRRTQMIRAGLETAQRLSWDMHVRGLLDILGSLDV